MYRGKTQFATIPTPFNSWSTQVVRRESSWSELFRNWIRTLIDSFHRAILSRIILAHLSKELLTKADNLIVLAIVHLICKTSIWVQTNSKSCESNSHLQIVKMNRTSWMKCFQSRTKPWWETINADKMLQWQATIVHLRMKRMETSWTFLLGNAPIPATLHAISTVSIADRLIRSCVVVSTTMVATQRPQQSVSRTLRASSKRTIWHTVAHMASTKAMTSLHPPRTSLKLSR